MEDKKPLIIIGTILFVFVMIAVIAYVKEGGVTGLVISNPLKTCRDVEVPYEVLEPYEEQEPYQATEEYQVPLKYEIVSVNKGTTLHGFDVWAESDVVVRNVDSETGIFTVTQTFRTLNNAPETNSLQEYIMPGEAKTFHQEYDIDMSEDFDVDYRVTPGEKTLTRTVTRYRTVTKYMTVTKYKTEEVCE